MRAVAFVLALCAVSGAARADKPKPAPSGKHHFQAQSMGTVVDVTLWTHDGAEASAAADAVFAEFRRIDTLMSNWVDTSDVSRINAAAGSGARVTVSDETLKVVMASQAVARKTGGAFDITVGAYRGLWKFDQEMDGTLPAPAEVAARRKLTGWRDVVVDARRKSVRLRRKGMAITLGGIAKGYAVDRGVAILRERGHVDFIVQAGGDLYVSGTKGGQRWRVGIRDPRGSREATFALTEVENRTFSTSGDYERGFVKDGVRYHHILDPKTGQPARLSRSVTVIAKDALTADAWDTALFVLGPERGLKVLKRVPDVQAVFVDTRNQIRLWGLTLLEGDLQKHLAGSLVGKILLLKRPTDAL
ncbi:MAG TPA: FAD:protein FMN transferase [Kofleriaceae bacterium]|nr:FAD:protein FMN transferase [Kofleriaceae bacterium]